MRKDKDELKTHDAYGHEKIGWSYKGTMRYYDIHRLVAIGEFGLEAVTGKVVHHKNGIPWDNRPSNLELIESQAEHARRHAKERDRDKSGRFV